jgi:hypothetical protein
MDPILPTIKGRGAAMNPPNRFEPTAFEPDATRRAGLDGPSPELTTKHFRPPAGPQMTLW